jgi:hypothetical protein
LRSACISHLSMAGITAGNSRRSSRARAPCRALTGQLADNVAGFNEVERRGHAGRGGAGRLIIAGVSGKMT